MVRGCLLLADGEACHVVGKQTSGRKVSGAFEQGSQVSDATKAGRGWGKELRLGVGLG